MKAWSITSMMVGVFLLGGSCVSQMPERTGIWTATPLTYPAVARVAQVQGDVRLRIDVDKTGMIVAISKSDGPDSLAMTALKEVKKWRYTPTARRWRSDLVIHYSLVKPAVANAPVARVTISTPLDVNVISNAPLPTGNPELMHPKK